MAMTEEVGARVVRWGNSVALRLPQERVLGAGAEMVVREEHGKFRFEPGEKAKAKIDFSGLAGKAPWLKPLPPELREFEERPSTIAARKAAEEAATKA